MSELEGNELEGSDLKELAEGAFWRFSLKVYGGKGMEEACLRLQDDFGLDVNLVLFCLWAGSRGQEIEVAKLAGIEARAAVWQAEAVTPLRQVRRWLKTQQAIDNPKAEVLRQALKAQELRAEAIEQEFLNGQLDERDGRADARHADVNLRRYADLKGLPVDESS